MFALSAIKSHELCVHSVKTDVTTQGVFTNMTLKQMFAEDCQCMTLIPVRLFIPYSTLSVPFSICLSTQKRGNNMDLDRHSKVIIFIFPILHTFPCCKAYLEGKGACSCRFCALRVMFVRQEVSEGLKAKADHLTGDHQTSLNLSYRLKCN